MYIVLELQTDNEQNVGVLVNKYELISEAESKYYNILSYAALSEVPIHAAVILNESGEHVKSNFYRHAQIEN